jgi:non-ribosomal peptide synthase protein (TIGR01720 family)
LEELNDDIDPDNVLEMLHEIGYSDFAIEPISRLAVYYSADRDCASSKLRDFLSARLPEYMVPTVYVAMEALPRTAAGKADVDALPRPSGRERALEAPVVEPRNDVERTLAAIWRDALGVDSVGVRDNFFDLGGDSITAIQIVARANREGIRISPAQLFRGQTVEALAMEIGASQEIAAEQGAIVGRVALTPVQCRFFDLELEDPDHWAQVVWLSADRIDVDAMTDAVSALVAHHDALRFRFQRTDGYWEQSAIPIEDAAVGLEYFDFLDLDEVAARRRETWVSEQLSRQLDLREGPLLAGAICRRSRGDRIVFVAHHLVVDSISWTILVQDLNLALHQLARGEDVSLPPKTSSFREWSDLLHHMSASDEVSQTSAFWHEMTASISESWLPSKAKNEMTEGDSTARTTTLAPQETEFLLTRVRTRYGAEIDEILLALLTAAVASATGVDSVTVDLEGHGRGGAPGHSDIVRTVGWFTTVYPLTITVNRSGDAAAWIKTVQDVRRHVPHEGLSYGLLRYLRPEVSGHPRLPASGSEILFNYLGRFATADRTERVRFDGELSVSKAPSNRRPYPLEVNAWVADGALSVEFSYANGVLMEDLASRIQAEFQDRLSELAEGRNLPTEGTDTEPASNFGMKSSQLERIASLLKEADSDSDS